MTAATPLPVTDAELDLALAAICASATFRNSPQQQRFLRHVVNKARSGDVGALREMPLAIDVFRRRADAFDPKKDPIVRVEAGRLRTRLAQYYANDGAGATVEIVVPIGSYVPVVRRRSPVRQSLPSASSQARDLEERAWYVMRLRTIEGYRRALELFMRATIVDPRSAGAYRGIAWARINLAGHEGVPPEAGEQREPLQAALQAARALEPDFAGLAVAEAAYTARFEYALDVSERLYRKALASGDLEVGVSASVGWLYTVQGRFDEAHEAFRTAFAADPFGFWHRHNLASLAFFRRDYAQALRLIDEALEIEPEHALIRLLAARVKMHAGQPRDALADMDWCMRALPGMNGVKLYRAAALARAGEHEVAAAALHEVMAGASDTYVSPVYLTMAHAAMGHVEQALRWLERAKVQRDYWLLNVLIDPAFDVLREHPAFDAVLREAGLASVTGGVARAARQHAD